MQAVWSNPMELVLIRHARPIRIEDAGGPADPALTDFGHRQAKAMAELMVTEHFDALYVSPMQRARQTAAPLESGKSMEAVVIPGVAEYDADADHYIPIEDVKADKAMWRKFIEEHQAGDMSSFAATVNASIEELIAAHRGDRIAIICHGGVINVWAANVLGLEASMFFEPDYTSVNRFVAASSGERSIQSLNETGHLRGLT
jgi:probable phosphoglycerate mutase